MPQALNVSAISTHQPQQDHKRNEVVEQVPSVGGVLHGTSVGNGR